MEVGTMGIIPEGQSEPAKTVICEAGGRIEQLLERARLISRTPETREVQSREECTLRVAREDVGRALALAQDEKVTRAELTRAIYFLAQSTRAAVDVAECRGELILAQADDDTETLSTD
jgi:hypothetical protein